VTRSVVHAMMCGQRKCKGYQAAVAKNAARACIHAEQGADLKNPGIWKVPSLPLLALFGCGKEGFAKTGTHKRYIHYILQHLCNALVPKRKHKVIQGNKIPAPPLGGG